MLFFANVRTVILIIVHHILQKVLKTFPTLGLLEESKLLAPGYTGYFPSYFIIIYLIIETDISNMKLNTPEFHSIMTSEVKTLATVFEKYGYEDQIRFVGGVVRDLLIGQKPHDLDFATTLTPSQMKTIFHKEGIRTINEKGEKHGTVTARIKENFEITTLRNDVVTNGRHAVVEFTTDWKVDAARRDLTINAMSLDLQGNLYDYFNGYADLRNRNVVFVGDPDARIKEDFLRILRYFRFFGKIANNPRKHDEATLTAIRNNASGLAKISGERIWSELSRILTGNFAYEIMKTMLDLGIAPYIGLSHPDELDMQYFENVCRNSDKYSFKPITYIAALLKNDDEMKKFDKRNKLGSFERNTAIFIVTHKADKLDDSLDARFRHFQRMFVCSKTEKALMRAYIMELLKVIDEELVDLFSSWSIKLPVFPIDGNRLKKEGISGRLTGVVLEKLREVWLENNFNLSEELFITVLSQFKAEENKS